MSYSESDNRWPLLLVIGEPVTLDQAYEVIIRTTDYYELDNNPYSYRQTNELLNLFGVKPIECHRHITFEEQNKLTEELKILDLNHLSNEQFYSSYVYGRHGWMNWNGTIYTSDYSIGKHPTHKEIEEDLIKLGEAFPFLNLNLAMLGSRAEENYRNNCENEKVEEVGEIEEIGEIKSSNREENENDVITSWNLKNGLVIEVLQNFKDSIFSYMLNNPIEKEGSYSAFSTKECRPCWDFKRLEKVRNAIINRK